MQPKTPAGVNRQGFFYYYTGGSDMRYTGAQILIEILERLEVKTVAGIPGGSILPVYHALADSRIKHVLARHEQGAGFIAQGMARSTGRPGVCIATSGPGATNLLTAAADAMTQYPWL